VTKVKRHKMTNSTILLGIYRRISILLLSVAVFTAAIDLFFLKSEHCSVDVH